MAERDSNGRFASGYKGGPGRPPKKREERFYHITLTACTFKDWREIVKKAVMQAKEGDAVARKFLADYIMGPPMQRTDVTTGGKPLPITIREVIIELPQESEDGSHN